MHLRAARSGHDHGVRCERGRCDTKASAGRREKERVGLNVDRVAGELGQKHVGKIGWGARRLGAPVLDCVPFA
jgi:hypothetical protein